MNKNESIAQGAKQPTARELSVREYGKWFAEKASAEELLKKCNERIAEYKQWTANLEILKAEKEAEVKAQRVEALKASVVSMSAEEKAELVKLLEA